jgi:hypothetical protein
VFAGAVTAFIAANIHLNPTHPEALLPTAYIHGYHVAFAWGAALFGLALLSTLLLINASKDLMPHEAAEAAAV